MGTKILLTYMKFESHIRCKNRLKYEISKKFDHCLKKKSY